jgi:predicted RecB family nuclease
MSTIITSEIVIAYAQCPRKAFLLLGSDEKRTAKEYVSILEHRSKTNLTKHMNALRQKNANIGHYDMVGFDNVCDIVTEAVVKAEGWEASCDILTKVENNSATDKSVYEPTLVVGTYAVYKEQKLGLLFVGYVIEKIQGVFPSCGYIVSMDGKIHKLKLENYRRLLKSVIDPLKKWTIRLPSEPPPIILNKNCPLCQFQDLCQSCAEKEDHLSLLDRMTPKLIKRYHEKGIFTIKQLSFLYRPRRNRKGRKKTSVLHSLELQALAIRTQKIYLQDFPEIHRHQVEIFLDIEGIPDQSFYYLIGLLICQENDYCFYSFWADAPQNEAAIWHQCIEKIKEYPESPIYHYGSYESKAIRLMATRYETDYDELKKRLANITTYIYGRVYFPSRSNKLKELGGFVGASWTAPDASGLQSLAWRYLWEETQDTDIRQKLILYNQEDCQAIKLLTDGLCKIRDAADTQLNIDYADCPKQLSTEIGNEIHNQFKAILRFAYTSYDRKKISFRSEKSSEKRKRGAIKGHPPVARVIPEPQKIIQVPYREKCPHCEKVDLKATREMVAKTVIDIEFSQDGVRRTITQYLGVKGYCPKCYHYYDPESCDRYGGAIFKRGYPLVFGRGFQSWIVFQRVAIRLPYESIIRISEEQFNQSLNCGTILHTLRCFSRYYSDTQDYILQYILASPFIHVDETKVNIQGIDHYVWVFTDGKHVIFRMTETREAAIVHELLKGYEGILVTDFYAGYDSVKCKQQKCWVHLIGDLNDDLWKSPFDSEFETFVFEVKKMMVPIIEVVNEHGLYKLHLGKFEEQIDQFYTRVIDRQDYQSELVITYQKRFERYRQSLFTFLEYDGIPWNNNTAERNLRHITVQEKISTTFYETLMPQYLLLLGIMQTCRSQDKSFLKFLLSGQKEIDKFMLSKSAKSDAEYTIA